MRKGYGIEVSLRQGLAIAAGVSLMLVASGCGNSTTRPMPHTEALVTADDIARVGQTTPAGVTLRLWQAVQVGDAVSAAGFYDQRVLRAIGFTRIGGALSQQRSRLEVLQPTILSRNRTALGVEIVVKGKNMVRGTRGSSVEVLSFLVRRSSEGWRVAYDTLLGEALPAYVYSEVQERVSPGSNKPSPKAQIAARRIGDLYRGLFSPGVQPHSQRKTKAKSG